MTMEYALIFIPFILCVTLFNEYVYVVFVLILVVTFVIILICIKKSARKQFDVSQILDVPIDFSGRMPAITNLFSNLLLCVCIAILAVDFNAFPRRFAKTETYGWSLMDVGVGGFIAINGGLSPESRLGTESGYTPIYLLKKTVASTVPLLILGVQRLIAVKSLNYHEHITEYGLHWNFFFTLAFTKVLNINK